jgi:hypothetical protein
LSVKLCLNDPDPAMENADLISPINVLQHAILSSKKISGQESLKPEAAGRTAINHNDLNRVYTSMVAKSELLKFVRQDETQDKNRDTTNNLEIEQSVINGTYPVISRGYGANQNIPAVRYIKQN